MTRDEMVELGLEATGRVIDGWHKYPPGWPELQRRAEVEAILDALTAAGELPPEHAIHRETLHHPNGLEHTTACTVAPTIRRHTITWETPI